MGTDTVGVADSCVHGAFERQVRRSPERVAVVAGDTRLTYRALDRLANGLARRLTGQGVGPGSLVGVCVDRDEWLVVALLGVLKAGAGYVALDPAYPEERTRFIVADAGLSVVVASDGAFPATVVAVGETEPADTGSVPAVPEDPAYVVYTSGTTGTPKGVVVEHRNLLNLLRWAENAFTPAELRGVLAASSVCFDASIMELFIPLAAGGTVVVADNLLALPTLPARAEVTMLFGVPSALAALPGPLPPTVLTGGEAVSRALCDRLFRDERVARVVNLYGPTECTVICAGADVDPAGDGPPPIGLPVAGAELTVRDADGAAVADGALGELWVSGPCVARGYLRRPAFGVDGYRTGDLVRRRGGVLHFAGRADDQVKVRGHRVEPAEVEAVLAGHPAARHAVVTAVPDGANGARLVGHVEAADAVTETELRTWLGARLPAYLVPARIAVLERLPVLPSGKVDRGALPVLPPGRDPAAPFTAPRDATERQIADIVTDVLGIADVGVDDRFTDLGGHSLAAARVVGELGRLRGVVIPPATFLRHPTVAELARALATAEPGSPPRRLPSDRYPLTATQREFWLLRQLVPDSPVTTVAVTIDVHGPVTRAAVAAALTAIVRRHEVLRSVVVEQDGEPVAVVLPPTPVSVTEGDVRTPVFDLTRAPLVRATMNGTELVVFVDHLAFDGGSVAPLLAELAAELAGAPVPEPPLQIGDLARHDLAAARDDRDDAYWRTELAGAAIPDDLPGRDQPPGHRSARHTVPLDRDLVHRVHGFAAESGTTPFAVHLAALGLVVGGLTGRDDVVIGAPAARRHRAGTEHLIGPLVDVLPLRLRMAPALTFRAFTRRCADTTTAALDHQELPTTELFAHLPAHRGAGASRTPVLLSMQPHDEPVTVTRGEFRLELRTDRGSGAAANELTVFVGRTATDVELQIEYALDRFDRADAERFADRLTATLRAGLATPDDPLIRHDLVDDRERADLLAIAEGPPLPASQLVVGAVLANAATRPNRHAVTDVAGALTYGELVARSASVAAGLVRLGVVPGDIVGVCLPRDRFLPAALLGVWRAGAAYLPMDPDHPADRLAWLAEDVGARTVLTADTVLDDGPAALPMVGPDDLAYVLFTSGSTGRPKAVAVTHANLAAGIAGVLAEPGLGRSDVMSAVAPLTFDVSAEEIWAPLTAGARCVMVERACATDGFALAERIAGSGVTVLDVTPTTLRMLLATGWTGDRELKVLTGGEVLDPAVAHQVLAMVGGLWNCYGPTETTISSTTHRVSTADSGAIPIGRPMPGERCYVMDPLGRLVPRGVVGELWLGGAGVARGYHGRPDLTEHAFVSDPVVSGGRCYRTGDLVRWRADGALEFVGRRDEQVKVRGYRIELGEVTAALRTVDGVADAAVAAAGTAGDTHLVGYLTPAHLATDVVEKRLRTVLPDHLVPRRWVLLDVLPTLANGKLDRAGLPAPPRESARDRRPPVGDAELLVADVWAEVLDRPQVWADDDFFALGGHSFAATRVVGRLRDALGLAVPVLMLFDNPVLADFAAALERSLLDDLAAQPQGTRA